MAEVEKAIQDVLTSDVKKISAGLETANHLSALRYEKSALRAKMLSAQIDSQFDALESLLTANHEEIMSALNRSDR